MKKEIVIDGVTYVPKTNTVTDGAYAIVRTASAGVFAGNLAERNGQEVRLTNARRLWYWEGAATLSQLANEGVKVPEKCKFPVEVPEVILTQSIEILPVSDDAKKSIAEVPVWEM